jgi:hypothetical protein
MTWLKSQVGTLLTAVTLLVVIGISFGQLTAVQEQVTRELAGKADKAAVTREFDQLHAQLVEIDRKVDLIIVSLVAKTEK